MLVRVELCACIHMVDFVSLEDLAAPSLEGAHKDRVACVFTWWSVRAFVVCFEEEEK